jgi:hypothetical protein
MLWRTFLPAPHWVDLAVTIGPFGDLLVLTATDSSGLGVVTPDNPSGATTGASGALW